MNVGCVVPQQRIPDVGVMEQCDRRERRSQDCEGDAVRYCEIWRQEDLTHRFELGRIQLQIGRHYLLDNKSGERDVVV